MVRYLLKEGPFLKDTVSVICLSIPDIGLVYSNDNLVNSFEFLTQGGDNGQFTVVQVDEGNDLREVFEQAASSSKNESEGSPNMEKVI